MGIVNLTDDSFSGDGLGALHERAVEQGLRMLEQGADLLDLGAESSRPGAIGISAQQEIDRLLPVIDGLKECGAPLSVDTTKPEVMRAVLTAGADLINDISALRAPGAIEALADSDAGICLMHMRGTPADMQNAPQYDNVVAEVTAFLTERLQAIDAAGIARGRVCLDPGVGFGKTAAHNIDLLRGLDELGRLGCPLLIGISRKSLIGTITGRPVGERLAGSLVAQFVALKHGARIVRTHDVAPLVDALKVMQALGEI
jgi:dihydropteroate synthase